MAAVLSLFLFPSTRLTSPHLHSTPASLGRQPIPKNTSKSQKARRRYTKPSYPLSNTDMCLRKTVFSLCGHHQMSYISPNCTCQNVREVKRRYSSCPDCKLPRRHNDDETKLALKGMGAAEADKGGCGGQAC